MSSGLFLCYDESTNERFSNFLAPVVLKLDSAIHWINLCLVDNAIGFPIAYLLGRYLSNDLRYPHSTSFPGSSPTRPPWQHSHYISATINCPYALNQVCVKTDIIIVTATGDCKVKATEKHNTRQLWRTKCLVTLFQVASL